MTNDQFDDLKVGDVIRHKNGNAFVVHSRQILGGRPYYVVARIMSASNPIEWDLVGSERNRL